MEGSPFAMDPSILESNLFVSQSGKKGKSQLCPNFLPHLFYYVKSLLSETERNSMKDYDVQVFIIETAIGQTRFTDLNQLCEFIINDIRGDIKYWIKGTEPFMRVYENLKKLGENDKKLDIAISSMKEENENAFREYREYYQKIESIYDDEAERESPLPKEIKGAFEESKITVDEVIQSHIEEYIPKTMNFNYETYDKAVDSYYTNKNDVYIKKVRTRWQDKRDKRLMDCPQEIIKNYVNVFKEIRDGDPNFANSIFVCNRNFRIPRIEIQLFPLIFQFITKKYELNGETKTSEQVFLYQRVQNLIYMCLMTDDKACTFSRHQRVYKAAFLENPLEIRTTNDQEREEEHEIEEEEKKEAEEDEERIEEEGTDQEPVNANENNSSGILNDFKQFSYQNRVDVDIMFGNDGEIKRRKFNLLNNALRICDIFISNIVKWELSIVPTLEVQDATFDNFKIRELIMKLDSFEYYSDAVLEVIVDYYHTEFERKNIIQYIEGLLQYRSYILKPATKTGQEEAQGIFSDLSFCQVSIENYQNYFNSPTIAKKRSYIFHTSQRKKFNPDECRKFLEGLHMFYDTPVNNKKIAKHIGPHIKSNHIRYLKGRYLRKLRKKAKSQNIPIRELLKSDIDLNNILDVTESF